MSTPPQQHHITHVIFDVDGTLLDTETVYTIVSSEIAEAHGKKFTMELKQKLMGKPGLEACAITATELGLPYAAQELLDLRTKKLNEFWPKVPAMRGARALVERLAQAGVPMAIATGMERDQLELKSTMHKDWMGLITVVVTSDDKEIKRGKPAPDLFLRAAELMGKTDHLETVLVVEDAANGVEAALAAGMSVVAVPDHSMSSLSPTTFRRATQVLDNLDSFNLSFWGLCKQ